MKKIKFYKVLAILMTIAFVSGIFLTSCGGDEKSDNKANTLDN